MPEINPNNQEEAMRPEPTSEQIRMWNEIEESLTEEDIETNARFCALPDDFMNYFASVKTAQEIKTIGDKYQLKDESIKRLSYIIAMVLLGETKIADFTATIQKECNLNQATAQKLFNEINQIIFLPVKESLKKIQQVNDWPELPTPQPEPNEPQLNGNIVDLKNQ